MSEAQPELCDYVHATESLWVCSTCGRAVVVVVGDRPLNWYCSGEFGDFDNVRSRRAEAVLADVTEWATAELDEDALHESDDLDFDMEFDAYRTAQRHVRALLEGRTQ